MIAESFQRNVPIRPWASRVHEDDGGSFLERQRGTGRGYRAPRAGRLHGKGQGTAPVDLAIEGGGGPQTSRKKKPEHAPDEAKGKPESPRAWPAALDGPVLAVRGKSAPVVENTTHGSGGDFT